MVTTAVDLVLRKMLPQFRVMDYINTFYMYLGESKERINLI